MNRVLQNGTLLFGHKLHTAQLDNVQDINIKSMLACVACFYCYNRIWS